MPTKILLLGAGELGTALLHSLSKLPNTHLTLGIRQPSKYTHLANASPNTSLKALDLTSPSTQLSEEFSRYDILISATGFEQSPGTVTKLAKEALEAGRIRKARGEAEIWYFPWQWGVDYDVTGDGEGLMPLFGEQKGVRDLLREKAEAANVKWTIVSTGIFMSFLFEPFWGVVEQAKEAEGKIVVVRALSDWEHKVTVTDVSDIGRVLARIVAGDVEATNRVVYIAGDTIGYGDLAELVARVTGKEVEREVWSIPHLQDELNKDPENGLKKYRLVFARDGVWWDKKKTVNAELGMDMTTVEDYACKIFIN